MTLGNISSGFIYANRPMPMAAYRRRSDDFENTALSVMRLNTGTKRARTSGRTTRFSYPTNLFVYLMRYLRKDARLPLKDPLLLGW